MLLSALTRSAKTLADRVRAEPEADYMINQHRGRSIEPCTYEQNLSIPRIGNRTVTRPSNRHEADGGGGISRCEEVTYASATQEETGRAPKDARDTCQNWQATIQCERDSIFSGLNYNTPSRLNQELTGFNSESRVKSICHLCLRMSLKS